MPHQNIFRCHIKRPGPRAGTKTAVPVGRARTPASPPFATNRTVTIPAILSSRTRAKAPCVHLRSITPCQASRIATAELRRQASLTLAFRPAVGGLEPRPPHSVSSARLGRRGEPHGIYPRQSSVPRGRTTGPPGRQGGSHCRPSLAKTRCGHAWIHGNSLRSSSSTRRGESVTRHMRYHLRLTGT